jgi:hypothetical protein
MQLDDPKVLTLRERFKAMVRRKAKELGVYESGAPYFWRWLHATNKLTSYERSRVRFTAHVERVEVALAVASELRQAA